MNITMFLIVAVIFVPGYFLVRRLSRTFYSDHNKLEADTEKQYGFDRQEKERKDKEIREKEHRKRNRARRRNQENKKKNETEDQDKKISPRKT